MLQLWHPGPASVPCSACKALVYDLDTGKVETYWNGEEHVPQPRPGPPPCQLGKECPKVSPEREHEFVLSERNERMLQFYQTARATGGRSLGPIDSLTGRAFRLIDSIVRQHERSETVSELSKLLVAIRR